jgi:hypothetical protein
MPFCTSCGKESEPGKKFCEYCGTPLELPAAAPAIPTAPPVAPAVPVSSQAAPVQPSGGSGKMTIVAVIVVILVIIAGAYFIGMPMLNGSQRAGSMPPQVTTSLTVVTTGVPVTFSTALTTAPGVTGIPASSQTYEEKYMETYNQIYTVNHAFAGGQKEVFNPDKVVPSLYIKFNIIPKMYYDERPVEIGTHNEHIANISYPSQNAWFTVRVLDTDDGSLVDEQGFNKEHSVTTNQEFMVRKPGKYRVEMTGNDVTADVKILTSK